MLRFMTASTNIYAKALKFKNTKSNDTNKKL